MYVTQGIVLQQESSCGDLGVDSQKGSVLFFKMEEQQHVFLQLPERLVM